MKQLLIVFVLFAVLLPVQVYAATPGIPKSPDGVMVKKDQAPQVDTIVVVPEKQTVDYLMPYPGILPDHPLYFLKRLRDQILDQLIVDPLRKSEFYILQADKRLGMGKALIEKGVAVLGEETISKGEKYLFESESLLKSYKGGGKEIPGYVIDHLEKATMKHIEILEALLPNVLEAQRAGIQSSLDIAKQVLQEVPGLK